MKKVLFVATVTLHINTFHIPYLKLFKDNGYEVHVASFGEEPIEYCDKHYNIPFERFPLKPKNYKAYKELKKIINENNYEIIHCHTPVGGVLTRLAAKRARKNGTRVIYTAHGFHFYKGAPLLNWIIYYPIEKYLAKYTDTLITINQEDYQLAKEKFRTKRIELVHGVGVDESKFDFQITEKEIYELRKSLYIKEDDFVIIYVAELSKRKNQGMLIEAVKELIEEGKKNIKVLLPGKDSLKGQYQRLVEKYKIQDNIKFLGFRNDIPKLMKISDLYVSTSKQEGLPVNIMEAMCCELPIIVTDCRGNRDLVIDNKNGYIVDIGNKIRFKENIKKLIKSKSDRDIFSGNSKKMIEEYLIERIIKQMEKIYFLKQGEQNE